ncbi:helix-turn-helix domain-containing protein [Streptomyces sp. NPDC014940]|uniref:helix-turn-helix domain-containing protein n=1 Tax=Streptomyces sp. NPDC014940 TaxID=3364932 RepID=UPI0036FAAA67
MSTDDRVQSVRNAWTNALRAEVLRVGRRIPEVARVVTVGMWIATYADADGSNSFPGRDTLATLCGCSQETVTRSVKVLMGVGVLTRKRRPNASSVYQLLIPKAGGLDWAAHIHHLTETRQRKAYAKKKAAETADAIAAVEAEMARKASVDAVDNSRTASTDAVENPSDSDDGRGPDSVRSGGSEPSSDDPDSVRGRPRTASMDAFRTASVAGVYQYPPTYGRDPLPDHTLAGLEPQPQQRAGEAAKDESSTGEQPPAKPRDAALAAVQARAPLARCTECSIPLPYGATGLCAGCAQYLATTDHERRPA